MSKRFIIGIFKDESTIIKAARALRGEGLSIAEAYTPYAIHQLNEAMDLPPSRLPWIPLIAGFLGCALALIFQVWVLSVDWPINVGGKPEHSWLALIPIPFEITVLFAGFASIAAFFWRSRLFLGAKPNIKIAGVTNDLFALALNEPEQLSEITQLKGRLQDLGAINIEEKECS